MLAYCRSRYEEKCDPAAIHFPEKTTEEAYLNPVKYSGYISSVPYPNGWMGSIFSHFWIHSIHLYL